MSGNKVTGDAGENEIVNTIPCPNCAKSLMLLPKNYPLYDIQCTGCSFRVQVKTIASKPKDSILGAGWDIMDKVLKSGYLIPPLIVNFKWQDASEDKQEIRFYPFLAKKNLRKYTLSEDAKRANYTMFRYIGLSSTPHYILLQK
jgi:DNA-directed RNA polymerase subunit RPC12/RpoP